MAKASSLAIKICVLFGIALNFFFLGDSSRFQRYPQRWLSFASEQTMVSPQAGLQNVTDSIIANRSFHEMINSQAPTLPGHYGYWDASQMTRNASSMNIDEPLPIIVELTGEFGNQLNHIAHGRALQTILWTQHQIPTKLYLNRHTDEDRYLRTQRQLKKCFKNLREIDFHGPKSTTLPSPKTLERIQRSWLVSNRSSALLIDRGSSYEKSLRTVDQVASILLAKENDAVRESKSNFTAPSAQILGDFSLPFIRTNSMINKDFMDRFYEDFRGFFEFDEEACCLGTEAPAPDEAVFHFRNFMGELKAGKRTGLEELSPQKVATQLFGKKRSSNATRVAIATRFAGRKASKEYFDELQKQGFQVRWLTQQKEDGSPPAAMQDFCAMLRAKELVGMVRSTFVFWAALLGNPEGHARLYSVDSKWTRQKFEKNGRPVFRTYNWSNPDLQHRIQFELHQA